MDFNLEEITQRLLKHPYFEKAKRVEEIGPGHPEDSVYTHLVQTSEFIKKHLNGNFITNTEARKLFQNFVNQKIEGISYSGIAVITGLVHDIGKILSYEEERKISPINVLMPNGSQSHSPNHEYYGSVLVIPLLKEVGVEGKIAKYISEIVRLHMTVFDYYKGTKGYSMRETIDYLKPRMEGLHREVCLNAYGDIAQNQNISDCWELLGRLFEEPHFYTTRKYFVE